MGARLLREQELSWLFAASAAGGSTPLMPDSNGSRGLVVQTRLITAPGRVRFSGLPLTTKPNRSTDDVTATPLETHTPDHFTGSWCNRQHGGLLIRMAWVRIPPRRLIWDCGRQGNAPVS